MRRSVLIPAVMAAVVLAAAVPAMADDLVGVLVDHACYTSRGMEGTGANHAECAIVCAQKGHRLALLTPAAVYLVTGALTENNNVTLIPLMNRPVVLTGTVGEVNVLESSGSGSIVQGDGRRTVGSQDGVVTKSEARKGDFREGDVRKGVVKIIEAISVKRVVLPTK